MRKGAADATKQANSVLLKQLPFSDTSDFDAANKGFMAALPSETIKGSAGNAIWNPQQYGFISDATAPDTVNPSLWRQSRLINISGLFEVTDGIYQVRNQDLSNMTIIEGSEGVTIVDPLVSAETAKVALDLYRSKRGNKPVKAVIYTHSHVDHYGGVRGVTSEDDVQSGKVKIYAPDGFLEAAVAENVMAGTAMSRRASYMYGNLLKADPKGQVGAGLGTTTSAGTVTLIAPTNIIKETGQKEKIDGLTYEFLMAPRFGSAFGDDVVHRGKEGDGIRRGRDSHAAQYVFASRRQNSRAAALVEIPQPGAGDVGRQGRCGVCAAPLADMG
ncbi:MBL fold metallo-hydrolase [Bradyrhizobium elkanii]|uniref:MBL fold metallo-hydrolase n=1 Tax=Bradyrhizobium elkanii TaxID=29448 RepID=UPI0035163E91